MKSVNLIECFQTYQGEGIDSGQRMLILRFKKCNLNCSWCDTNVKMRISMPAKYPLDSIQEKINKDRLGILVTGGEPTIPKQFDETLLLLNELTYHVANVESNGFNLYNLISNCDHHKNIHFMYSPKIFNKKDLKNAISTTQKLMYDFEDCVFVKVVFEEREEIIDYIEWISKDIVNNDPTKFDKVWLMPQGATRADIIRSSEIVFDACEKYKLNFSSRNHLIFGFI